MKNIVTNVAKKVIQYCYQYPKSALISAYVLYAIGGGTKDYLRNVDRLPVYRHDMIYLSTLRDDMIQLFQHDTDGVSINIRDTVYMNDLATNEIELQLQPWSTSYSLLTSAHITTPFLRDHIKHFNIDIAKLLRIKIPQKGEWHCPLVCMQYLIKCTTGIQVDTDQITENIGYDGNDDGYPDFVTMTDVLNTYMKPHGFHADRQVGVSLDHIDKILSKQWYVMVNINSQWGSPHWVVVVGKNNGRYLVHNSWRLMFDEQGMLMLCVSPQHPKPSKKINAWSYQSISPESLQMLMDSGLHGSFLWSVAQRALRFNTVAITVEPMH